MTVRELGCLSLLLSACVSALHAKPMRPLPTRQPEGAASAPALLNQAQEAYSRRPDLAAVQKSVELFRQAAANDEKDVHALVGAIRGLGWLIEHETDSHQREDQAVTAVDLGQECERRAPGAPDCDYWLALAIGLQIRERPSTATDGMKRMVALLKQVVAVDPRLDDGGPHRVLALLMLRGPAWPIGPGDPESGLVEAQQAVAARPDHAPNQLVLAEALDANGQQADAKAAYTRALEAAKAGAASDPDAKDWIQEAQKHLQ